MIKITTDSTADLGELFVTRDIKVLPLIVTLGEKSYYDGVDITPPDIFAFVKEKKVLPKTAARSIEEIKDFFIKQSEDGSEIIHFNISKEFSSNYEYACKASTDLKNVSVIDSRNLSTGQGLLVLYAKDLADQGFSRQEIIDKVNSRISKVQASFVVDTMEYLKKGGRCSSIVSLAATLLKIKPCIWVKDGKMVVGKKYMGSFEKQLVKYVKDTLNTFNNPDLKRIFITHTYASNEAVEEVKKTIISYRKENNLPPFEEIIETKAGCTVTSHCGKNTLGILYINDGGNV